MATSTQEVVSDGTLVLLDLSINYLDRSEITVFYDNLPAGALTWSWVGVSEKRIAFSPAIANGVTVLVKRTTDISKLRHEFSLGAAFAATTLDEDLNQVLHIAQEAAETTLSGSFNNDIRLNGNKIVGLAPGTAPTDGVNVSQLTDTYNAVVAATASSAASAAASAGSATASEAAALASAVAAAANAANAAASYDNFDDRYLGPKATNPPLDNDGNALLSGALYFNTTVGEMRVYTGTVWNALGSGGAVGGGTDKAFYENDTTITTSYTITAGKNAVTAGPVTIANGAVVTIPTGSVWTIV